MPFNVTRTGKTLALVGGAYSDAQTILAGSQNISVTLDDQTIAFAVRCPASTGQVEGVAAGGSWFPGNGDNRLADDLTFDIRAASGTPNASIVFWAPTTS